MKSTNRKLLTLLLLILCLGISIASAFSTPTTGTLQTQLEEVAQAHRGKMGIFYRNLKTGEKVAINADTPFPTASTIKTSVMCAAFDLLANGTGPYKTYYDTQVYDAATSTSGSGWIQNYQDGRKIELKELMHLMITVSDNIATNMLVQWIGIDKVNDWLDRNGFAQTRMFSTVGGASIADPDGRKEWGLGRTTPAEMARLMEMIATGKAGTTSTTDEMLRILGHQYFDGQIAASIPPMVYVGSKSGAVNRSRSDNAIVASPAGTYVLSVYTSDNEDTSWNSTNEAEAAIRKVSAIVWKHNNPNSAWKPAPGSEKF